MQWLLLLLLVTVADAYDTFHFIRPLPTADLPCVRIQYIPDRYPCALAVQSICNGRTLEIKEAEPLNQTNAWQQYEVCLTSFCPSNQPWVATAFCSGIPNTQKSIAVTNDRPDGTKPSVLLEWSAQPLDCLRARVSMRTSPDSGAWIVYADPTYEPEHIPADYQVDRVLRLTNWSYITDAFVMVHAIPMNQSAASYSPVTIGRKVLMDLWNQPECSDVTELERVIRQKWPASYSYLRDRWFVTMTVIVVETITGFVLLYYPQQAANENTPHMGLVALVSVIGPLYTAVGNAQVFAACVLVAAIFTLVLGQSLSLSCLLLRQGEKRFTIPTQNYLLRVKKLFALYAFQFTMFVVLQNE